MRQNLFKGAAAEHVAASYYLNRDEVVFWPAVPLETDFIVQRNSGQLDRVQVKYAGWNKHHGNYEHLHCHTYGWSGGRKKTAGKPQYDYLFVVSEDGR